MKILLIFFLCIITMIDLTPINLEQNQHQITVEVKGEVDNPGIFILNAPATFSDLLKEMKLNQNSSYDHLSLTQVLFDHQIIVIKEKQNDSLISINAASLEELMNLPGIGETLAKRIIEYRNQLGGFYCLEDLMKVRGIKESKFNAIKDLIIL